MIRFFCDGLTIEMRGGCLGGFTAVGFEEELQECVLEGSPAFPIGRKLGT